MRPTFGYIIAMTWAAQMFAIAYVIVFETNQAALVIEAVQSLGTIWAVGLSVLGIYVYKRSEEKKMDVAPSFLPEANQKKPAMPHYNR
jgi:biotin transporter BioY